MSARGTTTGRRLGAAPAVALVLSFAVVFGVGRLLAPDPVPAVPSVPSAPEVEQRRTVRGPDREGRVDLGVLQVGTSFATSGLEPDVDELKDGRLRVCVAVPSGQRVAEPDWAPQVGGRACTTVRAGASVGFRLEER